MADDPIVFKASFPIVQGAIKIAGDGGARIQLDIPESEMGNFIRAMTWRGKVITVTFALEDLTQLDTNEEKEADGNEKQADERPARSTAKVGRRRS